ncbi:MAG: hypothetical protein JXR16_00390 [Bermanella sp.]
MKLNKTLTALAVSASFGLSGQAFAGGTVAGTDITNTVTLGYTVSSTAQTPVESASGFKVDQKVDMTFTSDTATADSVPGEVVTLAYTLTNTGNKATAYVLALTNNGNADHSPQAVTFYPTATDAANNTNALANNKVSALAVDASTTVYAKTTITNNANIGNGDTIEMLATATALDPSDTDGSNLLAQDIADDKNANLTTEYVIFAEAASVNNLKYTGAITAQTDRNIVTAEFTDPNDANAVPKLAIKIINDVVCDNGLTDANTNDYSQGGAQVGTCPDVAAANQTAYRPKAIPTSMAKFTYSAENTGAVTANAVVFSEQLPSEYAIDSLANATLAIDAATQTLTTVTDAPDAVNEVRYDDTTGTITIYVGDVDAAEVITITFTAIVE